MTCSDYIYCDVYRVIPHLNIHLFLVFWITSRDRRISPCMQCGEIDSSWQRLDDLAKLYQAIDFFSDDTLCTWLEDKLFHGT